MPVKIVSKQSGLEPQEIAFADAMAKLTKGAHGGGKKKKSVKTASKVKTVKLKHKDGSETETHEEEPIAFTEPTCDVQLSAGQTVNVGNYNSVKFSVSLKMPCKPAEVESTFEFVKKWVDGKMTDMQKEVAGEKAKPDF